MRVLVTGHEGYIGPVLTKVLQDAGHEVAGLDAGYFAGCEFEPVAPMPSVRKDIRDLSAADFEGFDTVVHLAGLSNDPLGDIDPGLTYDINLKATVQAARLAREAGVRRFLFSSSCSIYGTSDGFANEEAVVNPLTAYAVSKARAEEGIAALANPEFAPSFLRNATVYGYSPRLRLDLVLNNLVAWACTTGEIKIMSDGSPWRPLVHVEDVARAFAACLAIPEERACNAVFNVGVDTENYQVRDLAEIVATTVPGCRVSYAPNPPADARDYRVDFSRIKRDLPEFEPRWNAAAGARELYEAFRRRPLAADECTAGDRYVRLRRIRSLLADGTLDEGLRRRSAVAAA